MEFNFNEWKPNLKRLAETLRLGPQKEILTRLDALNGKYLQSKWVYGNRGELQPIEPLTITKTFRWSPGYKDKVIECLNTRFYMFDRPTSSLKTLIQNRPENAKWYRENFIKELLDIDDRMKEQRLNGVCFADNSDLFKERYEYFKSTFNAKKEEVEKFISKNDNLDVELYITTLSKEYIEDDLYNDASAFSAGMFEDDGNAVKPEIIEQIQWENLYLVFKIKVKNQLLSITNQSDDDLGMINVGDYELVFMQKLDKYISVVATGTKIEDMNNNHLPDFFSGHRRYTGNISSSILGYRQDVYYQKAGRYFNELTGRDDILPQNTPSYVDPYKNNVSVRSHPFIADTLRTSPVINDWYARFLDANKYTYQSVCFGVYDNEFKQMFVRMDYVGMLMLLVGWNQYCVNTTHPLNNIRYSFPMKLKEHSKYWNHVSFDEQESTFRIKCLFHLMKNNMNGIYYNEDSTEFQNFTLVETLKWIINSENKFINVRTIKEINSERSLLTFQEYFSFQDEDDAINDLVELYGDEWGKAAWIEHFLNASEAVRVFIEGSDNKILFKEIEDLFKFVEDGFDFVEKEEDESKTINKENLIAQTIRNMETHDAIREGTGMLEALEDMDHESSEEEYELTDLESEMRQWTITQNQRRRR